MLMLLSVDFFQNNFFQKFLSGTLSECQMVCIQNRRDRTLILIIRRQKLPLARKELNPTALIVAFPVRIYLLLALLKTHQNHLLNWQET